MQAYNAPEGAITAVVQIRTTRAFQSVDITDIRLIDLYALYRVIEAPVIDTFDAELTIDLVTNYRTLIASSELTYVEWLATNVDSKLITSVGFPTLTQANIKYVAGYWHQGTYSMAKTGWHPSNTVEVDDMDDLIVDIDDIDSQTLTDNTLWSVGGYFLRSIYQSYGVRIVDAGNVIRRGKSMTMSMLNTESVGTVTTVPVTESNLSKMDDTLTYFDKVIIGTDISLTNKTVGIVLGGHLHLLDGFVNVIGDTSISISLKNFNYLDRIINSKDALDLSFLGVDEFSSSVAVSRILSDDMIMQYLTCQYTFIVVIDNPHLSRASLSHAAKVGIGKLAIDDINDLSWISDRNGRTIDVWPTYNCGEWVLNHDRFTVDNFLAKNTGWEGLQYINDALTQSKPRDNLSAYLYTYTARV